MTDWTHLRKGDWRVERVDYANARRFVEEYHYAGGAANTGRAHGLLDACGQLMGAALWLPPTKTAAVATFPEGDWQRVVSLTRLAVHPTLPTNAASFLLGRAMRLMRQAGDYDCLVTYADERRGHTGAIYRATNWEYLGLTKPEVYWVGPDGRQVARKTAKRNRSTEELVAMGCTRGVSRKHKYRKVLRVPVGGWYVTDYDGHRLPGEWPSEAEAEAEGRCGRYLLTGDEVRRDSRPPAPAQ